MKIAPVDMNLGLDLILCGREKYGLALKLQAISLASVLCYIILEMLNP
jgi:hypothetical protein